VFQGRLLSVLQIFFLTVITSFIAPVSEAQTIASTPVDVTGNWQVAWQGRLGTEQCTLKLQSNNGALSGTFQNVRGTSPVSGILKGNLISLDVKFQGARPYTTRFTGTAEDGKLTGTSQAMSAGANGAYLGHGGEIVEPEHPWTAKRILTQSSKN
jgi:hypothetical protein